MSTYPGPVLPLPLFGRPMITVRCCNMSLGTRGSDGGIRLPAGDNAESCPPINGYG